MIKHAFLILCLVAVEATTYRLICNECNMNLELTVTPTSVLWATV